MVENAQDPLFPSSRCCLRGLSAAQSRPWTLDERHGDEMSPIVQIRSKIGSVTSSQQVAIHSQSKPPSAT